MATGGYAQVLLFDNDSLRDVLWTLLDGKILRPTFTRTACSRPHAYHGSRKPPVYTQADKHSTRCRDGRPPAPHAKHALALSYDGFLCFQLRVSGYVGEDAEASEGCAACRQVSSCLTAFRIAG
jgi:hypothetical protein